MKIIKLLTQRFQQSSILKDEFDKYNGYPFSPGAKVLFTARIFDTLW
ncbi:MAG: hypothetical protein AAGF85_03305 [Bacteroidota bacterium]